MLVNYDPLTGGEPAPEDPGNPDSERMLFNGYVVGDTVKWDAETSTVQFHCRTADYWLQKIWSYEQHFYNAGQKGYGHFVSGLTFAWVIHHMLCVHSNFAEYHDVTVFIDTVTSPIVSTITLGEGPLWNTLTDWAKNEFGLVFSTRESHIYCPPDVRMRGSDWWATWRIPPLIWFDDTNTLEIEVEELPQNQVGFVRLDATNPFNDKKTLSAKYPSVPNSAGEWITESGIKQDSQTLLNLWAKRLYIWRNARYKAKVKAVHPLGMDVGGTVPLSYRNTVSGRIDLDASVGGSSYRRPFYCVSCSLNFDIQQGTFSIDMDYEDVPSMRWNESACRWEWYDGGAWYWRGTAVYW